MADELSPQLQQQIARLQALGAQLQTAAQQRSQMELMVSESKRAREAVEALAEGAKVYRSVGAILVEDARTDALARLGDDVDTLQIRVKRLRGEEERLQKELQSLQSEIEKALGQ